MFLVTLFIVIQVSLFFIMTFHDWVEIKPLTDISALAHAHSVRNRIISSCINSIMVLIPLSITLWYHTGISRTAWLIIIMFYGLLTLGTVLSWWVPYIFGSSAQHKLGFIEYKNTHAFLPPRGDNVIPNTLHCILHLHVWLCFSIALYFLCANI